ncbi:hypothetical protein [Laspinema palackyanum]|uniref:hypothetical protein n=1 Tax=Laspinema palackyanum TaxID=3231601 RepID=UPI00345D8E6F|nr:hypothetical protein [Laspinema sp. D2c]
MMMTNLPTNLPTKLPTKLPQPTHIKVFDPEAIEVQLIHLNGQPIPDDAKLEYQVIVRKCKIAYFRIPPEFRDFLMKVHQDAEIVGFEYNFEEAGLNFGIIVKDNDSVDSADSESDSDEESDDDGTEDLAEE